MLVRGSTVHNIALSHDPESARTGVLDRPLTQSSRQGNLPVSDAVIVVQFDLPMPQ